MTAPARTADDELLGKALDRVLLRRILAYAFRYRGTLLATAALLPLASVFELAQPFLLKTAIDDHIATGKLVGLDRIGLLYLLALVGQYGLLSLQVYLMQKVGQQAMNDLRTDLYRHVMRLSQRFFDQTPVGRLLTRLTSDIESLNEMFASGLVSLVADVIKLVLILIIIFALDVRLALFSLCTAPILFVIASLFRRTVREAFRDIRTRMARLNTFVHEHLAGVKIVQAFVQERAVAARFAEKNREYRAASARAISSDAALYAVVEAVGAFALAGLLWHGGGRIFEGTLTFGVLVAFVEYLQKFFAPIRDLSTKYTVMQQAMASAERVFALLDNQDVDAPPRGNAAPTAAPAAAVPDDLVPALEFDAVSFAYRPDAPVLHNVSIRVPRGHTVAVVGASGAGKSTLVKLLARFFDPDAGQIRLAGCDVAALPVTTLRRRVVVVGQDPFVFSGTIGDAIGLGEATPEEIRTAAARAGADILIKSRTNEGRDGLATSIAARGANVSAGERQLVALARALCRDPEILVLDEATANVDPEAERRIERGTAELMRGRTALVIAHRLSTIARADQVVVLADGAVAEQGTHQELLARNGIFAALHRLQSGGRLGDPAAGQSALQAAPSGQQSAPPEVPTP